MMMALLSPALGLVAGHVAYHRDGSRSLISFRVIDTDRCDFLPFRSLK